MIDQDAARSASEPVTRLGWEETMSTFRLLVDLDNAAFEDPTELARIVRSVADSPDIASMAAMRDGVSLRDINGNTVGRWQVIP